jgi:hypothetical protein
MKFCLNVLIALKKGYYDRDASKLEETIKDKIYSRNILYYYLTNSVDDIDNSEEPDYVKRLINVLLPYINSSILSPNEAETIKSKLRELIKKL